MAANRLNQRGRRYPEGYWGKWKGIGCLIDGCVKPAKCRGMCASHYGKTRRAAGVRYPSVNPVSRRAGHLRYRYGIDLADYDRLLSEQGGACAICGEQSPINGIKKYFCVDHDHSTGKVRGLLCNHCNLMVREGQTEAVLLRAAQYVRDHT